MDNNNIGSRIREIRKQQGLSQVDVAATAGIAVNSLRLYEANKRKPHVAQLESIARALSVPLAHLLGVTQYSPEDWRRFSAIIGHNFDAKSRAFSVLEKMAESESWNSLERVAAILEAYTLLNTDGQCEAVKRIEELTELDRYISTEPKASDGNMIADIANKIMDNAEEEIARLYRRTAPLPTPSTTSPAESSIPADKPSEGPNQP